MCQIGNMLYISHTFLTFFEAGESKSSSESQDSGLNGWDVVVTDERGIEVNVVVVTDERGKEIEEVVVTDAVLGILECCSSDATNISTTMGTSEMQDWGWSLEITPADFRKLT